MVGRDYGVKVSASDFEEYGTWVVQEVHKVVHHVSTELEIWMDACNQRFQEIEDGVTTFTRFAASCRWCAHEFGG